MNRNLYYYSMLEIVKSINQHELAMKYTKDKLEEN